MSTKDQTSAVPCSCAGMTPFTQKVNPENLKSQSKEIALSRNLSTDTNELAQKMSGVRDDSLKNAQVASIGTVMTQQKLESLPESVQSQSNVTEMSSQLSESQNNLNTQIGEVHNLNSELNGIEDSQALAISQKEKIEVAVQAQNPGMSVKAIQVEAQKNPEYLSASKDLENLNVQHAEVLEQYKSAAASLNNLSETTNSQLSEFSSTLSKLSAQAPSLAAITAPTMMALPAIPNISSDTAELLSQSLSHVAGQADFSSLLQSGMPAMPALSATQNLPSIPAVPAMPAFGPEFLQNGISFVSVPAGLLSTPEMPEMPAFPGTPSMPAVPEMSLDANVVPKSFDSEVLGKASTASQSKVQFADIKKFFPEDVKSTAAETAITQTTEGLKTKALDVLPAIPKRPELPIMPSTADLSSWAGQKIPTAAGLQANLDKFTPPQISQYSAFWTDVQGKYAATQRSSDALKETEASFQSSMINLAEAQKQAALEQIPLSQYLEKTSDDSAVYAALESTQVPEFLQKYSSTPKTPLDCGQACKNASKRNLFPDTSSPEQMKTAEFFANPNELLSTPGTKVIAAGPESGAFVNAHLANLESNVQASGGKVATLQQEDLSGAVNSPEKMIALEDKLKGSSLVTVKDVHNLSPQESALLSEISTKASSDVPVIMTTPSIGNLSTDPKINTAMIEKVVPSGCSLDVRKITEIPKSSVYDNVSKNAESRFGSQFFKKIRS